MDEFKYHENDWSTARGDAVTFKSVSYHLYSGILTQAWCIFLYRVHFQEVGFHSKYSTPPTRRLKTGKYIQFLI